MRFTIIRETNTVVVDGEAHTVDCSKLPADVHAVQWDGVGGEVEYVISRCTHCGARSKKANEWITDMSPYKPLVDAWQAAKVAANEESEKARVQAEKEAAENKAAAEAAAEAGRKQMLADMEKLIAAQRPEVASDADIAGRKA